MALTELLEKKNIEYYQSSKESTFDSILEMLLQLQQSGETFTFDLEEDWQFLFNPYYQKKLNDNGLMPPELVSEMYRYKLQKLINYKKNSSDYNKEVKLPAFPISVELIPLADDEMANYWRTQSIDMRCDIMTYIIENSFTHVAYRFSDNLMPNEDFFNDYTLPPASLVFQVYLLQAKSIRDYDSILTQFFANNIDKIKNNFLLGIIKTWKKIGETFESSSAQAKESIESLEEIRKKFMILATGPCYIDKVFDCNGVTDKFFRKIVEDARVESFIVLPFIDEEWEERYSAKERQFIKFFMHHTSADEVFWYFNGDDRALVDYFDDNGLVPDFYKFLLNSPDCFKDISSIGEDWINHYNKNEILYIELMTTFEELDGTFCETVEEIFSIDFDEHGLTAAFFQKAFNNCNWNFLCQLTGFTILLGPDEKEMLNIYKKSKDAATQVLLLSFFKKHKDSIPISELKSSFSIILSLHLSNSAEISKIDEEIANLVAASPEHSTELLESIKEMFLRNDIPLVGKNYLVFQLKEPKNKYDFSERSTISPILKMVGGQGRRLIIFSDLLKASLGSNNISMKEWLNSIEIGNEVFQKVNSGEVSIKQLDPAYLQILSKYLNILNILYNNTLVGKLQGGHNRLTGKVETDMETMVRLFSENGDLDYNMTDRIIKMFGFYAGITTLEQARTYMKEKIINADIRNRNRAYEKFELEPGDFIKGIWDIKYLGNILQNGSVAVDFLGADASSDATPLDTDLSKIIATEGTIFDRFKNTLANEYGDIWLVLKNDERFYETRTRDGVVENINLRACRNRLEVFYSSPRRARDHYCIRTGFASSEIDYIMCLVYDQKIGIEIAKNGFYIPVVNTKGSLVFSPKDYDAIRAQMSGLSFYDAGPFQYSDTLVNEEILEIASRVSKNIIRTNEIREEINSSVSAAVSKMGFKLKTALDGDVSDGSVLLLDTGATGRGTNMIGDFEFEFLACVDRSLFANIEKYTELRKLIESALPKNARVSFSQKSSRVTYSTEMAIIDRLSTIRSDSLEQYSLVVANIILAKRVLKDARCYYTEYDKGLGAEGIENWILANGGSFIQASRSFLDAFKTGPFYKGVDEIYTIYDFGQDYAKTITGDYAPINFISRHMSSSSIIRMEIALKNYLQSFESKVNVKKRADIPNM